MHPASLKMKGVMKRMLKEANISAAPEVIRFMRYFSLILTAIELSDMSDDDAMLVLDILTATMHEGRKDESTDAKPDTPAVASITIDSRCPTKSTH